MRRWLALLCAALAVSAVAAFGASSALGAGTTAAPPPPASNPFTPGVPQPTASAPPTTTASPSITTVGTTSAGSGSGFNGSGIVIIAIGALVVLGGIAFFIWYDARKRAPVRAHAVPGGDGLPGPRKAGSKQRAKPARKHSPAERRRRKRGRAR
jgi:hypothetical protein